MMTLGGTLLFILCTGGIVMSHAIKAKDDMIDSFILEKYEEMEEKNKEKETLDERRKEMNIDIK